MVDNNNNLSQYNLPQGFQPLSDDDKPPTIDLHQYNLPSGFQPLSNGEDAPPLDPKSSSVVIPPTDSHYASGLIKGTWNNMKEGFNEATNSDTDKTWYDPVKHVVLGGLKAFPPIALSMAAGDTAEKVVKNNLNVPDWAVDNKENPISAAMPSSMKIDPDSVIGKFLGAGPSGTGRWNNMSTDERKELLKDAAGGVANFYTSSISPVRLAEGAEGVLNVVGKAKMSDAANYLLDKGMVMTPGMIANGKAWGLFQDTENALGKVPAVGSAVRDAQRRSYDSFNRIVGNEALSPIGKAVPEGIEAGESMNRYLLKTYQDGMDEIIPKINFDVRNNNSFFNDIDSLKTKLPPQLQDRFDKFVQNTVLNPLYDNGGVLNGKEYKDIESSLSQEARDYKYTGDPDYKKYGAAIDGTREVLFDALLKSNPQEAKALQNLNRTYGNIQTVFDASNSAKAADQIYNPLQLLNAIEDKMSSNTFATNTYAANAAGNEMLKLARNARKVLPNTYPKSDILSTGFLGHALTGATVGSMTAGLPGVVGGVASALPYTEAGQKLVNKLARAPSIVGPAKSIAQKGKGLVPRLLPATEDIAGEDND